MSLRPINGDMSCLSFMLSARFMHTSNVWRLHTPYWQLASLLSAVPHGVCKGVGDEGLGDEGWASCNSMSQSESVLVEAAAVHTVSTRRGGPIGNSAPSVTDARCSPIRLLSCTIQTVTDWIVLYEALSASVSSSH